MSAGNLVGILFSFILFIIGMIFSAKGIPFFCDRNNWTSKYNILSSAYCFSFIKGDS